MPSPALPILGQGPAIGEPTRAPRPLEYAWLELTHRCNLRCLQCYTNSSPRVPLRTLPTERWLTLLEEIVRAGGRTVQLTGGEATEHPDLRPILEHAVSLGLAVEVFTNATSLDDALMDRFAELGVGVATSLHSHLPEVHDAVTRTPGSHARTVVAIEGLVRRGIEVRVAATLMAENATHARDTEALVRELGVLTPFKADPVRPTGRGRSAEPPAELAACGGCDDGTFRMLHTDPSAPAPSTCWDGRIAVSPVGEVFPCIFSRTAIVGNVTETPLPRVLAEGPLAALWSLSTDDVEDCRGCDKKGVCFDCRALPLMALGDVRAKNPRCDYVPPVRARLGPRPERLARRPGTLAAQLADEWLLVDPATAQLHRLDDGAMAILDGLAAGGTIEALAKTIAGTLGAPEREVLDGVTEAADALFRAGLLVPADEAAAPDAGTPAPPLVAPPSVSPVTSPPPVSTVAEPARVVLDLLGVRVSLEAGSLAWPLVAPLVAPLASTDTGGQMDHRLTITSRRSSPRLRPLHHLLVDGVQRHAVRTPGALRSVVEETICGLAASAPGALRLHAAAVAGARGAALLPGPPGTGKSLLSLHAAAAGLAYLGDEVSAIGVDAPARVWGLGKPVTVKRSGAALVPPALAAEALRPDDADPDGHLFVPLPPASPADVAMIVVPMRTGAPAAGLTPLSPGDAVEALVTSAFNLGAVGVERAFLALCRLAERVPCYALDSSDLERAAAALAEALDGRARVAS